MTGPDPRFSGMEKLAVSGMLGQFFSSDSYREFSVRCAAAGAGTPVSEFEFRLMKDAVAESSATAYGRVNLRRYALWLMRSIEMVNSRACLST